MMIKKSWRLGVFAAVLCLSNFLTAVTMADTPREIAKRVSPSVVLLVMEDSNGQPLSMGSGFVVREGVVATNLHVIEGAGRGYAKLADQKTKFDVLGVVASDPARDLVLLSVEGLKATPLAVGDSTKVAVGDEVYAVGNPRGLEGTFSAGIVSSVRKVEKDSLLQVTAPISPGSSGGPMVNSKGEVIGIAVATFKGGQNLNFAIPSHYLSAMIPSIKKAIALPDAVKANKGKKEKSILDDMGGRSTDGVEGTSFTWDDIVQMGNFSCSIKNKLREPVKNVYCLVVFYDAKEEPIDVAIVEYAGIVPGGLAKRVKGKVDDSVEKLNTPIARDELLKHEPPRPATGRIEFRVLSFEVVNQDKPAADGGEDKSGPKKIDGDVVEAYRKAANAGDASAMQLLGRCYQAGVGGLAKDEAEALKWYRKAADARNAAAMADIGFFYKNGLGGLTKDEAEALRWYQKAANAGNVASMSVIGTYYATGLGGLKKDEAEALKWLRKAADAGDGWSMFMIGTYYQKGAGGLAKDDAEALKWYRRSADAGEALAMFFIGGCYRYGNNGLAKDDAEALRWYRKAAGAGYDRAMVFVGQCCEFGVGTTKDMTEAATWYAKAAASADPEVKKLAEDGMKRVAR